MLGCWTKTHYDTPLQVHGAALCQVALSRTDPAIQSALAAVAGAMTKERTIPTNFSLRDSRFHSRLGYESIGRICLLQVRGAAGCGNNEQRTQSADIDA